MYSYIYLNGEDNFDGNNNGGDDDSFFVVLFYSDPKKVIDPVTKWTINDAVTCACCCVYIILIDVSTRTIKGNKNNNDRYEHFCYESR